MMWNFPASSSFKETVFMQLLERQIKKRKVCFRRLALEYVYTRYRNTAKP